MRGCQCPGVNECLFLPSATDANARRYIVANKLRKQITVVQPSAAEPPPPPPAPAVQGSHPIVRAFRVSVSVEGMRLPLLSVFLSPTDDIARDARPHSSRASSPPRRAPNEATYLPPSLTRSSRLVLDWTLAQTTAT